MIEFVEGSVVELSPTHVVLNSNGIGYMIHISLNTFEHIQNEKELRIVTHLSIKEDSHTLYGFSNALERIIFRHLIGVSGVGTATARMILSSLNQNEVLHAIMNGNVPLLKSIKGIGPKAAQRLILELQDKFRKIAGDMTLPIGSSNSATTEAVDALLALGFARTAAEKAVQKVSKDSQVALSTEELIKNSLKLL